MSINDFEIINLLGKGAFSTVSLVKRKQDNKIYALKCVQISKLSIHEKKNSLNEVRLLASINHKNIISYKESFYNEENQTLNIILEYADDGDLQTKIISKKSSESIFEEKTIWSIFIQMVKGLNELHNKKIIHRDLKSANIFLMKNGICKLGDLNVAKVVENGLLRTQTGTPYFASPEIWEDKPYSFKSDIWSIGCILYQMAALQMPFQGKNIKEVYYNLKNIIIPPLPKIYSEDLMSMIKKLLQLDPEMRPSTQDILNDEIIINKMKMFENDNDLINISMDINNLKKNRNSNRLINSININDDKNLNYILPKKNYEENDKLNLFPNGNNNINSKEKEVHIIFSERNISQKFNIPKDYKPIIKQNFSFHEEEPRQRSRKKVLKKNINSLNDLDENGIEQIVIKDRKIHYINKNVPKRQCISAKNGRNIKSKNSKEKENNDIKKKEYTENSYQYKKIKPISKKNNLNMYIDYNHLSQSSSDNDIQKNYGTAEDNHTNNVTLKYKHKLKNRINNLKRVNSFLLTNKKTNTLKKNKITKNNSQYAFPLVNNKEYSNERKCNKKIILENNLNGIDKLIKDKNNNLTLELNHNINDIFNTNINSNKTCKNKDNIFNSNNKEKIIYQKFNYNFNTEKGKKLIPNHPLKYGKPIYNTKELNKNQNYYNSHNNLNDDIVTNEKYIANNLLKKLFALSPKNEISDKNIIIQNNNINIKNNYNIKKKVPFVLNFNQRNESSENIINNNHKKELFPIINNNNNNINKKELKLPKLPHIPIICLSNKGNDEEINNKNILMPNIEENNIEPVKKMLINPIKIIEKKDNKIKLNPINSQIRITKLNDINNNAYK